MAQIQFTVSQINASLQVGDTVYFTNPIAAGEYEQSLGNITVLGKVAAINIAPTTDMNNDDISDGYLITCNLPEDTNITLTSNEFLFFSKDNAVNTSSVLGYYGQATFKNNSYTKAELYAAACEVSESSK